MDLGKSFVAHSKTMEIMEPSMSTFDYPSIFSETTAMLGAALRKNGFDTPIAQFLPVCFGVVSAIGIDDLRLFQRAPANTTNGWNRVNERQQLCDVIAIGTGQAVSGVSRVFTQRRLVMNLLILLLSRGNLIFRLMRDGSVLMCRAALH